MTNAFHGPTASRVREVRDLSSMKSLMKASAARASVDVLAEFGIERDGSFEQERRDGLVVESGRRS